jgi:hypothetical protein
MLKVISGQELYNILSRIKSEKENLVVISALTSRVFRRCKKTKKVLKAMRSIEEYRNNFSADSLLSRAIFRGMNQNFEIHPCEQKYFCFSCKYIVCSAEFCINSAHNHSFECNGVWVCGMDPCVKHYSDMFCSEDPLF